MLPPLTLDVGEPDSWPTQRFDAVFSANTLHIISWPQVQALFANLPRVLARDAVVLVYGPFNIGGRFTSASNADFDAQLRSDDPQRGIRDIEAVQVLATDAGLEPAQHRRKDDEPHQIDRHPDPSTSLAAEW